LGRTRKIETERGRGGGERKREREGDQKVVGGK